MLGYDLQCTPAHQRAWHAHRFAGLGFLKRLQAIFWHFPTFDPLTAITISVEHGCHSGDRFRLRRSNDQVS